MLSKHFDKEKINTEYQEQFRKSWFNYVHEQKPNLLENNIFNYDVVEENSMSHDIDYDYWLNVLYEIESDIYFITNPDRKKQNIELVYNNAKFLYNSVLFIPTFIVSLYYYMTIVSFDTRELDEFKALLFFINNHIDLLSSDEKEYYLLVKGVMNSHMYKEPDGVDTLKYIVDKSKNDYIISYGSYSLLEAYRVKGMYIEILKSHALGKDKLTQLGCHNRLVFYDGILAIANMFLGNEEQCAEIQEGILLYCSEFSLDHIYNFILKQLVWTYIRTNNLQKLEKIYAQINKDSSIFSDKMFNLHWCNYFIKVENKEKAREHLLKVKDKPSFFNTYDLFVNYIEVRLNNEDPEQILKQIVEMGISEQLLEVGYYYTPILIEVLKDKRKYKDIVEMQYLILNTKIEQI